MLDELDPGDEEWLGVAEYFGDGLVGVGGFMKSSRSAFSLGGFIGAPGAASGGVELPHAAATRPTRAAATPATRPRARRDDAVDMRATVQLRAFTVQTRCLPFAPLVWQPEIPVM